MHIGVDGVTTSTHASMLNGLLIVLPVRLIKHSEYAVYSRITELLTLGVMTFLNVEKSVLRSLA